jgi:hypothetical protein
MNVASFELTATGGSAFHQLNVDSRVTAPEVRQERRNNVFGRLWSSADAQRSNESAPKCTGPLPEGIDVCQKPTTASEQVLTFKRQLDVPTVAIEQRYSQLRFQRADLTRSRRLGQIQLTGGAREPASVSDCDECA